MMRSPIDRLSLGLVAVLLMEAVSGCATPSWLCWVPPGPRRVNLIADPSANNDSAVAVDLVLISDQQAASQIETLTAPEFFAHRQQLERDFPGGFEVRSWELAPGQILRDQPVHGTCNRVRTMLFARYATPGDHRQTLQNRSPITIWLKQADFTVTP